LNTPVGVPQGLPGKAFKFTGGDYCYNAGARKALVALVCGPEEKLLMVDEPRTCE
jgi:hypothetical protein